jgi:hypothetical protein
VRPSRARQRHGQIAELRTELTDRQHGHAVARVLYGDVVLHISLSLTRTMSGWEVTNAHA